ncbi:hypothetical protein SS50377_23751 [Spironucleus salmonicida]|uniref:Uncharacterized protein n=1 Tax=Spironucleus salmonicida TaxID=348837 RepID=V6LP97_9EUKA|nr:hypothetical protein SS50377_23751 [Spironucleus salmonicida]|eukprot:EST46430.1 Hypothetical protein SS50377_13515 [Spironucleus salmonicida]
MQHYLVRLETPSIDAPQQFMSSLYDQFHNHNDKYKLKLLHLHFNVKNFELMEFNLSDSQIVFKLTGENILYKKTQENLLIDAIILGTRDYLDEDWEILPHISCEIIQSFGKCGAARTKINHNVIIKDQNVIKQYPKILQ